MDGYRVVKVFKSKLSLVFWLMPYIFLLRRPNCVIFLFWEALVDWRLLYRNALMWVTRLACVLGHMKLDTPPLAHGISSTLVLRALSGMRQNYCTPSGMTFFYINMIHSAIFTSVAWHSHYINNKTFVISMRS